jgi:hypothetical protein
MAATNVAYSSLLVSYTFLKGHVICTCEKKRYYSKGSAHGTLATE